MSTMTLEQAQLRPDGYDRHGAFYKKSSVSKTCVAMINTESYFARKAKVMTTDVDKATELTEVATKDFERALSKLMLVQSEFVETSKKASGSVRDSVDKMASGLSKLEKAANFDRLERYAALLERCANALTTLAELDKDGRLNRIAGALK